MIARFAQSCSSTKDKENAVLHLGHEHVLTNSGQYYECLNMLLLNQLEDISNYIISSSIRWATGQIIYRLLRMSFGS
jgi:hypothetical protein